MFQIIVKFPIKLDKRDKYRFTGYDLEDNLDEFSKETSGIVYTIMKQIIESGNWTTNLIDDLPEAYTYYSGHDNTVTIPSNIDNSKLELLANDLYNKVSKHYKDIMNCVIIVRDEFGIDTFIGTAF